MQSIEASFAKALVNKAQGLQRDGRKTASGFPSDTWPIAFPGRGRAMAATAMDANGADREAQRARAEVEICRDFQ
jgi:hypothetical protein